MAITYSWDDPDNTTIKSVDDSFSPAKVKFIPVDESNRDYAQFLASAETPAAYVEPEA